MTPLLHLSGVGKDYAKLDTNAGRIGLVLDLLRGRGVTHAFRALDDVSFELAPGESLGIIGENGAGKSTLLKIVAGVITPTRGSVDVRGRVGALLELGSGFHPEYSGLANIDLAAALLGLAPAEIAAKRDEIVAFADIGEHIHDPIKHYSSGMVVRLGFAVATALRPDILITDEVLSVGDESFQKKCRAALWLKDGRIERHGPPADVTQAYLAYHEEKSAGAKKPIAAPRASAEGYYAIQSLTIDPPGRIAAGATLGVHGEVYSPDDRVPVVLIGLVRADGTPVYGVATDMDGVTPVRLRAKRFAFSLTFPQLPLLPGKYLVRAHALDPEGVRLFDNVEQAFVVEGTTRELGLVRIDHAWNGSEAR